MNARPHAVDCGVGAHRCTCGAGEDPFSHAKSRLKDLQEAEEIVPLHKIRAQMKLDELFIVTLQARIEILESMLNFNQQDRAL